LTASGVPGAEADGRTIASLARAMLTRSPAAPERADQPLAELRPGLPKSVIDATEALLSPSPDQPPGDVTTYIASIAMAEALKTGEDHLDEARRAMEEQQRLHREQIEKE